MGRTDIQRRFPAPPVSNDGQSATALDPNVSSRVGMPLHAQMGVPHPFEELRSDADRSAEVNRPFLASPEAFV